MKSRYPKEIARNVYWSIYGGTVRNPPMPRRVRSVLFICLGNICRSPFAERFAAKYSDASNGIVFSSAGIRVDHPRSPPVEAVESARGFGVDLRDHASRQLRYDLVESNDMILAVEAWQFKYMRKLFMEHRDKIFHLPLFCAIDRFRIYEHYNIRDPFGRDLASYNQCFERVKTCLSGLLDRLNANR
jgi:protein-tyrosine phosphatase